MKEDLLASESCLMSQGCLDFRFYSTTEFYMERNVPQGPLITCYEERERKEDGMSRVHCEDQAQMIAISHSNQRFHTHRQPGDRLSLILYA